MAMMIGWWSTQNNPTKTIKQNKSAPHQKQTNSTPPPTIQKGELFARDWSRETESGCFLLLTQVPPAAAWSRSSTSRGQTSRSARRASSRRARATGSSRLPAARMPSTWPTTWSSSESRRRRPSGPARRRRVRPERPVPPARAPLLRWPPSRSKLRLGSKRAGKRNNC